MKIREIQYVNVFVLGKKLQHNTNLQSLLVLTCIHIRATKNYFQFAHGDVYVVFSEILEWHNGAHYFHDICTVCVSYSHG